MVTLNLKEMLFFILIILLIIIMIATSTVKGPPLSPWQLSWPAASPQIMSSKILISDHGWIVVRMTTRYIRTQNS